MKKLLLLSLIIAGLQTTQVAYSQSAKKFYKSAEKFMEVQNYEEAINNFTKTLELDPNYNEAYLNRAACYEKTGKKSEAIEDYKRAIAFSPKDKELYYKTGNLYFELKKYKESDLMLSQAIQRDKNYAEAIDLRIKTLLYLKNFKEGLVVSELAMDIKKTSNSYYNHAVMYDSLLNFELAEKEYKQSKYYDSKFIPAYIGLAGVQMKLNKFKEAIETCEAALAKDPANKDIFNVRSQVYAAKGDFQNAIADLSKVITAEPKNTAAFILRGDYYQKQGQFQNAINDYTKALLMDEKDIDCYLKRASAFEQLANYKASIADYEKVVAHSPDNLQTRNLLKNVKAKLYELNKESNEPSVSIFEPKPEGNNVFKIPGNKENIFVKGTISDASEIKSITINGATADYTKDTLNPKFSAILNVSKLDQITIAATDIYNNVKTVIYTIEKMEVNKPEITLVAPAVSYGNEVYLDNTNAELYIEGKIKDESQIESIVVESSTASYTLESLNPTFSTKISIANKGKFTIKVKDIYGNETIEEYKLNRESANMAEGNPMGTTWVIFIENSTYQSFSSLEGPARDVTMMKSAFANYKINKIIHKKNLSKSDLEKFFSIELRDLVRGNNVTSILLWYAGHGKFVSQTGYWIPVDAKVDDEFTYFNINSLKAYMQSYSKVVHTLVITDACESGPSFYLAMRDTPKERRCEDWEATKFKSSQVLSSAGYELAADNSQFTKTFATALNYNPDGCISIEKIAEKIAVAVKQTATQVPKLGKINGLEDEDGTFFFIKK